MGTQTHKIYEPTFYTVVPNKNILVNNKNIDLSYYEEFSSQGKTYFLLLLSPFTVSVGDTGY